ncbi:CRE-PTL-1 protein [Caenorhabditis remanei]|uniref:Microtubule-associated protein n=1 Tax=Caenorhabditis remanei TaxID=31234 RepID=E3ML96_CAERE|nr:CRE-PTL-1 protein [Caenorhabditis remanei]
MDEIASSELESLKFSEAETSPLEHHDHRVMQNNENETVEVKKQISPTPMNRAPARSGIRPPSAILRTPKAPVPAASIPRPSTIATPSAPRTISTPRQSASTAPSPRPISKMSRERSDVQKSTSTRSIDNVGKFTPKVNAKFVNVKSKVGSVTNHRPGGGNVEIFSEKKQYQAQSKVGSLKNATHVPGGGNVQIESRKLDFSYASPKVGSKTDYQPARSDVKIVSEKLTWQAKSKVGSMDNAAHKPTGGNVQILSQKLNWKAESKVGSKDNMNHRPGGGNVKIFDEKIRYVSSDSSRNHSALDISSL